MSRFDELKAVVGKKADALKDEQKGFADFANTFAKELVSYLGCPKDSLAFIYLRDVAADVKRGTRVPFYLSEALWTVNFDEDCYSFALGVSIQPRQSIDLLCLAQKKEGKFLLSFSEFRQGGKQWPRYFTLILGQPFDMHGLCEEVFNFMKTL